jgi:hypothetical protein
MLAALMGLPPALSVAATPRSPVAATQASGWTTIDQGLAALGPKVSFLAASVTPEGTCHAVHEVASSTPRPTASQFKLFVLGALANQISAGRISWDQNLMIEDATKSVGNEGAPGAFEALPQGTLVSVQKTATNMISISDNTAADMLIGLIGRENVEAQVRKWASNPSLDDPFLTTREMFLLHYVPGLANQYLATPRGLRDAFLASSVDPLPLSDIGLGFSTDPRFVEQVEWFASPDSICRAFAGLQQLSKKPTLSPLSTILSQEDFGIGLNPSEWPTVWFKGGSEPGVLTLGWLATDSHGRTFVVEAMVSNPDTNLSADSITKLVALSKTSFSLLSESVSDLQFAQMARSLRAQGSDQ